MRAIQGINDLALAPQIDLESSKTQPLHFLRPLPDSIVEGITSLLSSTRFHQMKDDRFPEGRESARETTDDDRGEGKVQRDGFLD